MQRETDHSRCGGGAVRESFGERQPQGVPGGESVQGFGKHVGSAKDVRQEGTERKVSSFWWLHHCLGLVSTCAPERACIRKAPKKRLQASGGFIIAWGVECNIGTQQRDGECIVRLQSVVSRQWQYKPQNTSNVLAEPNNSPPNPQLPSTAAPCQLLHLRARSVCNPSARAQRPQSARLSRAPAGVGRALGRRPAGHCLHMNLHQLPQQQAFLMRCSRAASLIRGTCGGVGAAAALLGVQLASLLLPLFLLLFLILFATLTAAAGAAAFLGLALCRASARSSCLQPQAVGRLMGTTRGCRCTLLRHKRSAWHRSVKVCACT